MLRGVRVQGGPFGSAPRNGTIHSAVISLRGPAMRPCVPSRVLAPRNLSPRTTLLQVGLTPLLEQRHDSKATGGRRE